MATTDPDSYVRPIGCVCTHEEGDSDCPIHLNCESCGTVRARQLAFAPCRQCNTPASLTEVRHRDMHMVTIGIAVAGGLAFTGRAHVLQVFDRNLEAQISASYTIAQRALEHAADPSLVTQQAYAALVADVCAIVQRIADRSAPMTAPNTTIRSTEPSA